MVNLNLEGKSELKMINSGKFLDVMHGTNALNLRAITIRLWNKIFKQEENIATLSLSETVPGNLYRSEYQAYHIFPERIIQDSLNTADEDDPSNQRKKVADYGNFLSLLHNTMDFVAKTKRNKKLKSHKAKNIPEETFLKGNARLYLQVLMYCKRRRLKTEQNLHSK